MSTEKEPCLLTAYLGRCLEEPRSKAEEAYDWPIGMAADRTCTVAARR